MSSFPFFRLPLLIQILILKNANPLELFYFSLISKRSKQIVKSLNSVLHSLEWILDNPSDCQLLRLLQPNHPSYPATFDIYINRKGSFPLELLKFNGSVLSVSFALSSLDIQNVSHRKSLELMDRLTKNILEIFNVNNFDLTWKHVSKLRELFVWKHTRRFRKVIIRHQGSTALSSEDAKFLLEQLTITDRLHLLAYVENGFEFSKPLKMKSFTTHQAAWLKLGALLDMECEHVYFMTSSLTFKDVNTLIKKWLDGGIEKLQQLQGRVCDPIPELSDDAKYDQVLEGIETVIWENRPERARGRPIHRNDGTMATVDVRDISVLEEMHFEFRVWQAS